MGRYGKNELAALLPMPAQKENKYTRGKLVLFAGSEKYPGAAVLAACAGQRAGAGYTEVLTAPAAVAVIQSCQASLVVRSWEDADESELIEPVTSKPRAYVLGPGFDPEEDSTSIITYLLLGKTENPVLVDGGALFPTATKAGCVLCNTRFAKGFPTVITPHAGEAARLAEVFGLSTDDPANLSYALSSAYGAITVLKGPDTFISNGKEVFAVTNGTPALAKAGTGDVLAGVIGAFLAQGLAALDAAVLGATLHAEAGVLAAEELTAISVTPEDLIAYLPAAIRALVKLRI